MAAPSVSTKPLSVVLEVEEEASAGVEVAVAATVEEDEADTAEEEGIAAAVVATVSILSPSSHQELTYPEGGGGGYDRQGGGGGYDRQGGGGESLPEPILLLTNVDTCRLWWWRPILWWWWRLSAGRRRWRRPLVVAPRSNLHTSTTDMTFDERQTDDEILSDTTRLLRRPFLDSYTGPAVQNERPKWRFHWQHHVSLTISLHSKTTPPLPPSWAPISLI